MRTGAPDRYSLSELELTRSSPRLEFQIHFQGLREIPFPERWSTPPLNAAVAEKLAIILSSNLWEYRVQSYRGKDR
jgi:hypothetical protein